MQTMTETIFQTSVSWADVRRDVKQKLIIV